MKPVNEKDIEQAYLHALKEIIQDAKKFKKKLRLEEIKDIVNKADVTEKFEGDIFKSIVNRVIVGEKSTIEIEFQCAH
jgi:hypothetical protein